MLTYLPVRESKANTSLTKARLYGGRGVVSMLLFLSISLSLSSTLLFFFSLPLSLYHRNSVIKQPGPLTKKSLRKRCFAANFRALRINFPPRILVRMEREDPAGRRFPEKRALLTRRRTTASRGTTER